MGWPKTSWAVGRGHKRIADSTWWEGSVMEGVSRLMRGEKCRPSGNQDRLNQRTYEDNKDRPLSDVLETFDASGARLETLVSSLTDEQLNAPGYYPTYDGIALLPIIRAGTIGHYPAHFADLRAYIKKAESRP